MRSESIALVLLGKIAGKKLINGYSVKIEFDTKLGVEFYLYDYTNAVIRNISFGNDEGFDFQNKSLKEVTNIIKEYEL